jgi:hypothetical protein
VIREGFTVAARYREKSCRSSVITSRKARRRIGKSSDEARCVTGHVLVIDAGLTGTTRLMGL